MSESVNSTNNSSLLGDLKNTVAFAAVPTTFGALTSVARNRSIKGAVDSLELQKFKALNQTLKTNGADSFSRAALLSESYDTYKNSLKQASKLSKNASKAAKKGDISLLQKIKNIFSKDKVTVETLNQTAITGCDNLKQAKTLLANGKTIAQDAGKIVSTASKAGEATAKGTLGKIFKSEIGNKLVLAFTLAGAIPRIKEEIIPAFKEKGFIEGIKTTGNVIARTAVDFVSNAGFSAIGRTIGMAAGSIFPGVGNFIGGILGDAVGSCISMRLTNKIFDENNENVENAENINNQETQIPQENNQELSQEVINNNIQESNDSLTGNAALDEKINRALTI